MDAPAPDAVAAPAAAPAAPQPSAIVPYSGWAALAQMDRRGWMAVGVIAGGAAVIGGAMGAGVLRTSLFPVVLMAAVAVSVARAGWGWLRGRSRRARLREGVLSRVEQYGGGVYGTGAAMTLLMLSAGSLQREWAQANGLMDFLRGMTLQFWMGFSAESVMNAVHAGMWPVYWYTQHGVVPALAVGAAAWAGDALADAWRRREAAAEDGEDAGAAVSAGDRGARLAG